MNSTDTKTAQPSITEREFQLLECIVYSDYHDGRDPVNSAVWQEDIFDNTKTKSGVMGSLVKKGFVVSGEYEKPNDVWWITAEGFEAYTEYKKSMEGGKPSTLDIRMGTKMPLRETFQIQVSYNWGDERRMAEAHITIEYDKYTGSKQLVGVEVFNAMTGAMSAIEENIRKRFFANSL